MPTMTMKLNADEMAEAVKEWLEARSFKVTGPVALQCDEPDEGDPRDPVGKRFTASATVERVVRKRGGAT